MKKISILFVALLGLVTVSCDKDFEEINVDPNQPLEVPANLLLSGIVQATQNTIYNMQTGGDMGMCWAQHVSKVQYNDEERYIPRRALINAVWNGMYVSVISDAKSMYTLAEAEGNENLMAISLVLQANAFEILTDLYGPVPFNEVFVLDQYKPAYDSQEVVYQGLLGMLDQADVLFASGQGEVPATSDIIYAGNVSKWRKLCNALKFKALMRIANVVDVSADLQAVVDAGNMMTSTADSAQLVYLSAQPNANPIYETIVFGARSEYKVSSVLVENLEDLSDPRLEVYAQVNDAGEYVGNVPGVELGGPYPSFSSLGTLYLSPTLPGVILSYAQQELLLAEAINDGLVSGTVTDALAHYNNGIVSNFEFNGLGADVSDIYIAQPNVTFASQIDARSKIGIQMWLALYGQGFEAWTEWRRTGYPALNPVFNHAPGVDSVPSRLFYNDLEPFVNTASYNAAVATLPGGDQLTSKLWWQE